jgi:murein DD-endopeptidase MepM/ murein hydrolase activator NlpD
MTGRRPAAALACVLILAAVSALPGPALAAPEEDADAAQRRANAAARELAEAQEEMARAEDAVAQLQARVASVDRRVVAVRDQVRQLAIRLYVEGTGSLTRLLRMADANQLVRAQQFGHLLAGTSTDSLRQYRVDREDLRTELEALESKQEERAEALENLRRRQAEAIEEIDRLTEEAALARAARDGRSRTEVPAAGGAAAPGAAAAPAADGQGPAPPPAVPLSPLPSPADTAPPVRSVPADDRPPPTAGAPVPAPASSPVSGGWICPVQGPHAFSDDYGDPRGGGYTHQGNDILAARGTPVVASVAGYVTHRNGPVSGLAYYLDGEDGNEYFGAHLDSFGASGQVSAGTVVGTVGDTGDAAGGPPHLHFEIHPGGRGNINPYPILSRYC